MSDNGGCVSYIFKKIQLTKIHYVLAANCGVRCLSAFINEKTIKSIFSSAHFYGMFDFFVLIRVYAFTVDDRVFHHWPCNLYPVLER